jgi:hypothetical protein
MPVFVYTLYASSALVHLCMHVYILALQNYIAHIRTQAYIHDCTLSRAYMYTQYIMCTNIVAFIHIHIHT